MKLPKGFKYKGNLWRVEIEDGLYHDDGTKCHGLCDLDKKVIYLESSLSKSKKIKVLYHELFHVLMHESRVPEGAPLTESIEEILADHFSDLLSACFTIRWNNG